MRFIYFIIYLSSIFGVPRLCFFFFSFICLFNFFSFFFSFNHKRTQSMELSYDFILTLIFGLLKCFSENMRFANNNKKHYKKYICSDRRRHRINNKNHISLAIDHSHTYAVFLYLLILFINIIICVRASFFLNFQYYK